MHSLYRQQILDHYKHPHNFGHLQNPQHAHCEENTTCGDKICIDISFDENNIVTALTFHGNGCAISQASASLLTDKVLSEHLSKDDILNLSKDDILNLLNIELSPIRLKCALLPLETLQKTISSPPKT